MRRAIALLAAIVALSGALAVGVAAPPAKAADWGGNGNPATACPGGYTVAQRSLVDNRGRTIGRLELRWAWSCHGNWSRVVIYGGLNTTVTIGQSVHSEGRAAGADDRPYAGASGTSAWSPYLRLANSNSRACVYTDVSYRVSGSTRTASASLCA